jgi:hypothetical protein
MTNHDMVESAFCKVSLFCGITSRSKHIHACITKHINYKLPMKILASTLKSFRFRWAFMDRLIFRCDFLVEYSTSAGTMEGFPVPLGCQAVAFSENITNIK